MIESIIKKSAAGVAWVVLVNDIEVYRRGTRWECKQWVDKQEVLA